MTGERFADLARLPVNVRVGGYRAEFVSWGHIPPGPWRNYLHLHSFFEVCYAYAGSGTLRVDDVVHTVRAGDVFVAAPGRLHQIEADHRDPLGIYFWGHTLIPDRAPAAGPAQDRVDGLLDAFTRRDALAVAAATSLEPVVGVLAAEAARPDAASAAIVRAQAVALVLHTARAVANTADSAGLPVPLDPDQVVADTIERYLRDNADRPIRLRDLAAQVHLSERHTSRVFRRVVGTSIRSFLLNLRLEIAAQRLLEERRSITEVARACGYSDVRHFSTAFRRGTGLTPTRFRDHGGTSTAE